MGTETKMILSESNLKNHINGLYGSVASINSSAVVLPVLQLKLCLSVMHIV